MGVIPSSWTTLRLFELKLTSCWAAGVDVRQTLKVTTLPLTTVAEPLVSVIVSAGAGGVVALAVEVAVEVAELVAVGVCDAVAVPVGVVVAVGVAVSVLVKVGVGVDWSP